MNIGQQVIFLFSALGATNGFALSGYFLFKKKEKRVSDYFLGGLLLMLSIRVIKSAFLYFNAHLFDFFIEFGLAACLLIGPFLFLYVRSMTQASSSIRQDWWWHVVPYILIILLFSYFYSYHDHKNYWGWFVEFIYKQWMIYIFISGYWLVPILKKAWERKIKLTDEEFWLLNIFIGTTVIWLAYETSDYTAYIVGALSFTFILYISILLWLYKRSNRVVATDTPLKYANSSLNEADIQARMQQLCEYVVEEKPFLDPDLTLDKLSEQLGMNSKELSQVINQSTGQNYSQYVAKLRIEEAKRLLSMPSYDHYKIAAVAFESGFNSLASFNVYFKKMVGTTAQAYRKQT